MSGALLLAIVDAKAVFVVSLAVVIPLAFFACLYGTDAIRGWRRKRARRRRGLEN